VLLAQHANTQAWRGRFKDARQLTRRAVKAAIQNDAAETAAVYQTEAAIAEVEAGNAREARADAGAALKLATNNDVLNLGPLALALAGDPATAEKLATDLDHRFPINTIVQRYRVPTIRAAIALERHDPKKAIELLQVTRPYELGDFGYLLPVYIRGKAYLELHQGKEAAAEFQKFVDQSGVVQNFPWGSLARLQSARAYELAGDRTRARAAYQDFLMLWKDADPDVPVLKQAKAEYARLQ
jgi:eukaryotic-like serine/threonine-protein kinase